MEGNHCRLPGNDGFGAVYAIPPTSYGARDAGLLNTQPVYSSIERVIAAFRSPYHHGTLLGFT